MKRYSAGGVVLRDGKVVVVSQSGDSWSLPKGHVDPGEDALMTAKREIQEESGITNLELVKELGTYERYRIGKDGIDEDKSELKIITIFLFTTQQIGLMPQDKIHPEAIWTPLDQVASLLTHPKDKEFFQKQLPKIYDIRIAHS